MTIPHANPTTPDADPTKRRGGLAALLKSPWIKFSLRWGVAVVGIVWILSQLTIRDRVNVLQADNTVVSIALREPATEESTQFYLEGIAEPVGRDRIVSAPDRKKVKIFDPNDPAHARVVETDLWGLHLTGELSKSPTVDALIIKNPFGTGGLRVTPDAVPGGFKLQTPRPVIEKGLARMVREANPWLLALSVLVFPVTMFLTTVRWNEILRSQEIRIPFTRVLVLNLVGNFYNSFLPGSTGGDFAKAFYASRQTPYKIRAVISVFVDRVIGLLALVMLGGTASAIQWLFVATPGSPTAHATRNVTLACVAITVAAGVGGLFMLSRSLRRSLGINQLVGRLPMQHHLKRVREIVGLYRAHALRMFWWIAVTLPVHATVVVSALLAGKAFNLPIDSAYYFVCVPVMVLSASLPISPQGAGVMEGVGYLLLAKQGAGMPDVLAITLSIRAVQILWNLVGGIFVLRGGFEAPQSTSIDSIADEEEPPEANAEAAPEAEVLKPQLEGTAGTVV
jgi:uncharacterized membrane protein YbhN (UPF0104 family)